MEVTAKDSPRYSGVQNLAADKLERMEKEAKVSVPILSQISIHRLQ